MPSATVTTGGYVRPECSPENLADGMARAWWALEREIEEVAPELPKLREEATKKRTKANDADSDARYAEAALQRAEEKIARAREAQDGLPRR